MTINPFIPLPVMIVISILLLFMRRKGVWNYIKQIIIVLLIFGMNLRILIPAETTIVAETQLDILFVVDNTISMLAEDYSRNNNRRIDAVKNDVNDIIEAFPGARFGLITFNNRADCVIPYTTETNLITQSVNSLEGMSAYIADGTSLNISIDEIENTLERNVDISDDDDENLAKKNLRKRIQVIFYFSDGEITNGERIRSFENIADYIDTGAVLGYGTRTGGVMHVRQYLSTDTELLQYYNDNFDRVTARSYIDEDNLESIAQDMDVPYYHMERRTDINDVIDVINSQVEDGEFITREEKIQGYGETYQYFAMALIVFISIDFVNTRLKMRQER